MMIEMHKQVVEKMKRKKIESKGREKEKNWRPFANKKDLLFEWVRDKICYIVEIVANESETECNISLALWFGTMS